jgi:hypothetical protein
MECYECGWLCVIGICLRIGAAFPPGFFWRCVCSHFIPFYNCSGFRDDYVHGMWFQPCHILFHMIQRYLWLQSFQTNACFELLVLSHSWWCVCVSVYLFACCWTSNDLSLHHLYYRIVGRVCWSSWHFWNLLNCTFACCILLLRCVGGWDVCDGGGVGRRHRFLQSWRRCFVHR